MGLPVEEKTKICYNAVIDKQGNNVVVLDLKEITSFTDYFIICSGNSSKQVQSIADEIVACLKAKGTKGINVEGYQSGKWVLLDCLDVIVHVFHEETRKIFDIERLWGDAPVVNPVKI